MQQIALSFDRRVQSPALLSLIHPSKELFQRHRALLRRIAPSASINEDDVERRVSQFDPAIQHRDSTLFMRVTGDSMRGLNIYDGDLLAVDRSVPATHGCVVIAAINGELTVRQLLYTATGKALRAAHPDYPDMVVRPENDFSVWGVVQWNVHRM